MEIDTIDRQLEHTTTRRRVIKTGAKLAYTAPLVAASFKLSNAVGAQSVSSACLPGTCTAVSVCGTRCGCRTTADGSTSCLRNIACVSAQVCGAGCPTGFVCLADTCCGDGVPRCVPKCPAPTVGLLGVQSAAAEDGPPDLSDGPWVLGSI